MKLPALNIPTVLLCLFSAAAIGGCSEHGGSNGADIAFLTAPLHRVDLPNKQSDDLLPLVTGNRWQMRSITEGKSSDDVLTVLGPAKSPTGQQSIAIDLTRNGAPWRKEMYSEDATGIYLTAMKDETSPMMSFNPPIPLLKYGFQEGQYWRWDGTDSFGSYTLPATAYSRISAMESYTMKAGKFDTCRIDTIITLNNQGHDVRFPMVRWLAPKVGFVRRGFADRGRPAFSELMTFDVH